MDYSTMNAPTSTPNTDILNEMNALQASLRAAKAAQPSNVTNDLGFAIMASVARRIAKERLIDNEAALKDYKQSISAMTANEVETFNQEIVRAAIVMGG